MGTNMSEFNEEIEKIEKQIGDLNKLDIRHNDLGIKGFQDADNDKNEFCLYLQRLLERYKSVYKVANKYLANIAINQITQQLNKVDQTCTQINQLVEQNLHQQNYPNQRETHISNLLKIYEALKNSLSPFINEIRLCELENIYSDGSTESLASELSEKIIILDDYIDQAKSKSNALSSASAEKVAKNSKGVFSGLSSNHKTRERNWFIALITFSALLAVTVFYIVTTETAYSGLPQTIADIFKRLLVISTAAIGMRISLKKYNLERNLRIIYEHRSTALDNYAVLEAAIFDDPDRQNQLRLEIAKYVFTDPETGYKGSSSKSEVSINPVLNTVEKVTSKVPIQ